MAESKTDNSQEDTSTLSTDPGRSVGAPILRFVAIWLALVECSWLILSQLPINNPSYFIYVIGIFMLLVTGRITSLINTSFGNSPPLMVNDSRRTLLKNIVNYASLGIVARVMYSVLPYNPLRRAPSELFLQPKRDITIVGSQKLKDFELLPDTDTPVDILVLINAAKRYTTPAQIEMAKVSRKTTKFLAVVDHHEAAYETWRTFRKAGVTNLDHRLWNTYECFV